MSRYLKISVLTIAAMLLLISCRKQNDTASTLDFGTHGFKEPFVGILKNHPSILEKSLNYPPFSWFTSDTVVVKKTIEIEVNDEFLRGNVDSKFAFVGVDGQPFTGVTILLNGISSDDYVFKPVSGLSRIEATCRVDPSVGDADINGSILVMSKGIDLINNKPASTDVMNVMEWHVKQDYGVNWFLWLLWLLTIALILGLLVWGIYLLCKYCKPISMPTLGTIQVTANNANSNKKKEDKKKEEKKLDEYLAERQEILFSSSPVRDKAIALYEAFQYYDFDLAQDPKYRDEQFQLMSRQLQSAFEDLWKRGKFYYAPKRNGIWSGEEKNSLWIPDDSCVPIKGLYSNIHLKTWKRIKKENKFKGLRFEKGRALFVDVADKVVRIDNFDDLIDPRDSTNRERLHEEAFRLLAEIMGVKKVDDVRKYKEGKNLVWHEDHDCCTLYLVPREIHDNINHFGGVGMLKVLRDNHFVC